MVYAATKRPNPWPIVFSSDDYDEAIAIAAQRFGTNTNDVSFTLREAEFADLELFVQRGGTLDGEASALYTELCREGGPFV